MQFWWCHQSELLKASLKKGVFCSKVYDVIISAPDVKNKIL